MNRDGALVIPLKDSDGQLWSLQFIAPSDSGEKLFLTGGKIKECFYLLGAFLIHDDGSYEHPLCVAEGFATAASIHLATGFPVYVGLIRKHVLIEFLEILRTKLRTQRSGIL